MNIAELIGFLIMIAALGFSLIRQIRGEARPQTREEKEEYDQMMRELLASIDPEEKKTAVPPPLPSRQAVPSVRKNVTREFEFHGQLDEFETHTNIEDRQIDVKVQDKKLGKLADRAKDESYKIREKGEQSYLHELLKDPRSQKDMVLLNEVLSPPLSIRDE